MDDSLDLTEKTPRAFESEALTDGPGQPITIPVPKLASEIVPLSQSRAADGTRTGIALPPPIPHARRATTIPPPIPTGRRSPTLPPPIPQNARRSAAVVEPSLVEADRSLDVVFDEPPRVLPPLPAPSADWLRATRPPTMPPTMPPVVETVGAGDVDVEVGATEYVERPKPARNLAAIVGIGVAVTVVAVVLGVGLSGGKTVSVEDSIAAAPIQPAPIQPPIQPAPIQPAPIQPALVKPQPAPAPPPIAKPAPPPQADLATLPITSTPAGASVTLIGDGNATVIGRTPVTASIDPTKAYDVVVALRGHATRIRHVDASTTLSLAVELEEPPAAPLPPTPTAPRHHAVKAASPKPITKPTAAKPVVTAATPVSSKPVIKTTAAKPAATAANLTNGVLMVSSKPPCDIAIDGKSTGLMTPQREIRLAAGTHALTLTNAQSQIRKTIAVKITAGQTTRVLKDLTPAR